MYRKQRFEHIMGNPYAMMDVDYEEELEREEKAKRDAVAKPSAFHAKQTEFCFSEKPLRTSPSTNLPTHRNYSKRVPASTSHNRYSRIDAEFEEQIELEIKAQALSSRRNSLDKLTSKRAIKRALIKAFESYSPSFQREARLSTLRKKLIDTALALPLENLIRLFSEFEKYILDDLGHYEPMLNRESRSDDELCIKFENLLNKHS